MKKREAFDVMDLKSLRCFSAMARHGSLTKAAIELGIAQAAVSQRVKALEHYLGVKLYESRGGRVRLTQPGERAVSLAISMFDEIEEFEHVITRGEETGEIVLSSHDEVLSHLLLDIVEKFSRAHPLARLRLLARPVETTVDLVKTNEVDLGVVPDRNLPKELDFYPIATYPAYLLTPKGHPLARRARSDFKSLVNAETIMQYPLVVAEVQLEGYLLKHTFTKLGLPLNIAIEVGTIDTVKHYVARGLGIAAISGLCLTEADHARLEIVPIPSELGGDSTYGVIIRKGKHRSLLMVNLLRLLGVAGQIRKK
jgi:DNA-binding transcriptional LysR family regulator